MNFVINKTVITKTPTVIANGGLKPGVSRFRLVVVDGAGNRSKTAEIDVLVYHPLEEKRGLEARLRENKHRGFRRKRED